MMENRLTLKRFLTTALAPAGQTLYIYGGGWNPQDTGAGRPACTIGVPYKWKKFFQCRTPYYDYRTLRTRDGQNLCRDWGADCSGYVGWCVYNFMETESGKKGYVFPAETMARIYGEVFGWGTFQRRIPDGNVFAPGDIISIPGHVWICLGVCQDESVVLLHSTPSERIWNYPGGGVQISALGENKSCMAYQLADSYMRKYFPGWSKRYRVVLKPYEQYTDTKKEGTGRFTWRRGPGGLEDPEGLYEMTAGERLQELFGENRR